MKKLISIITILTLCTVLTACSGVNEKSINGKKCLEDLKLVRSTGGYYVSLIRSFEDLESWSDLIVVGEFIDDSEICYARYEYDEFFQKDVLMEVASSCPMKITKVLAGDSNVGDVVNVLQKEGIDGDRFITETSLTPMQKGDEWLFCLTRTTDERLPDDGYWCVSDNKGRYPTKNSASNEVMCFSDYPELGVYDKDDFQEDYYNQLLEKYGDLI